MTLDQIIKKAKTYVLADLNGEHNLGEVIEGLRDRVLFLEGQAQAALELELSRVVPITVHLKEGQADG
tara:strand:+ start:819 stop:1022 length:204 start_codon:yes stop_codon:yes gene_type:complete